MIKVATTPHFLKSVPGIDGMGLRNKLFVPCQDVPCEDTDRQAFSLVSPPFTISFSGRYYFLLVWMLALSSR